MTRHLIHSLKELAAIKHEQAIARSLRDEKVLYFVSGTHRDSVPYAYYKITHKGLIVFETTDPREAMIKYNAIYQSKLQKLK